MCSLICEFEVLKSLFVFKQKTQVDKWRHFTLRGELVSTSACLLVPTYGLPGRIASTYQARPHCAGSSCSTLLPLAVCRGRLLVASITLMHLHYLDCSTDKYIADIFSLFKPCKIASPTGHI